MMTRQLVSSRPAMLVFVAVFTLFAHVAEAAKRVALLIGNQQYESTTALKNPANDVQLMKRTLEDAGFDDVQIALDLDLVAMRKTLRAFEDTAYGAEVAVLYYSGHGMEMNGRNYLIPVDARLASDKDIEDETVALDRAERALDGATRLKLIILDACRNNPFLESMSRSVGARAIQRGLAKVEPQTADTLVAYASKAGTVAMDGQGENSPFAEALSKYLTQPGVDVRIALGKVRDEVVRVTANNQEPFVYGSLGGAQIFLNIKELTVTINTPSDKKDETAPNGVSEAAADWQNIRDLADRELLEAFIAKHGKDPVYRMLAEKKLKMLEAAEAKADFSADQIAWDALKGSSDAAALQRFIERYPDSSHRAEAEAQIAALVPKDHVVSTGKLKDSPSAKDCYLLAGEPDTASGFAGVALEQIDSSRARTACQTATKDHPTDGMLFNLLGRAQQRAGDFAAARASYEKAMALGDLHAMVNLAWFSIDGLDGQVDVAKGQEMLKKAAISGNAGAQSALARLYRDGATGIPQDYAEAMKWYSQAANQGDVVALSNLGWFYRDGLGVNVDYVQSLAYYRKAAEAGDATSMAAVGYAAQNGLGMAQDYKEARIWFEKAAQLDDAYSMASLGFLYDAGYGVDQDYVEARYWYEKAAYKKDAYAMASLSRLHEQGLGTKVDAKEAVRWAVMAVESGDKGKLEEMKTSPDNFTPAFRREMQQALIGRGLYAGPVTGEFDAATLAALDRLAGGEEPDVPATKTETEPAAIEDGVGAGGLGSTSKVAGQQWVLKPNVKSRTSSARTCYELAGEPGSEAGFPGVLFPNIAIDKAIDACKRAIADDGGDSMLHDMLGRAYDIQRDYAKARASYERALEMGNSHALANLAWLAIYGSGEDQDMAKGMTMMLASANAGNSYAQASLGWIYREGYGGTPRDYQKAFEWYEKAAMQDYANAQASLGWLYREGLGVDKDLEKSLEWYMKGAANGDVNAMGSVGYALQNGIGTNIDYVEARKWYERGAEAKDAYSMASLAWLYENGNGVSKNLSEAKYWYEQAANLGNTYAMGNLSFLYDAGQGTRADVAEAARLAIAALEGGEQQFIEDMKNGATRYSPAFRREMQRQFQRLGHYTGPIDGVFGAATADAITKLTDKAN